MILKAKNLTKTYKEPSTVEVLRDITLEIPAGSTVAITGKSGEGKSTLLHILGTLEEPTSGEIWICGKSTKTTSLPLLRSECIGFIFQTFNLLDDYTTLENVAFPAKIAGTKKNDPMQLLRDVGLEDRAHFPARLLSGGEKQRAAIARALCNDPPLLLADEPSGNLDHATSQHIHQLLLDLSRRYGKTLVIVTHDLELAKLCDTAYHLTDGSLCTF
ncbi:MAG: ABC transporter ATP-binding protein [Verrucomicrobia bacterium]|nr:ABC transporter ATP-binding protein [Verrucomicrobiota bacterium]